MRTNSESFALTGDSHKVATHVGPAKSDALERTRTIQSNHVNIALHSVYHVPTTINPKNEVLPTFIFAVCKKHKQQRTEQSRLKNEMTQTHQFRHLLPCPVLHKLWCLRLLACRALCSLIPPCPRYQILRHGMLSLRTPFIHTILLLPHHHIMDLFQ